MVEYQAIARVLRLGQTRSVRVVRYIMKDTVEGVSLRIYFSASNLLTWYRLSCGHNSCESWDTQRLAGKMEDIRRLFNHTTQFRFYQ